MKSIRRSNWSQTEPQLHGLAVKFSYASQSYTFASSIEDIEAHGRVNALEHSTSYFNKQEEYFLAALEVSQIQSLGVKPRPSILALGFAAAINDSKDRHCIKGTA